MSRPKKTRKSYIVKKDIVKDICNNPEKYRIEEKRKSSIKLNNTQTESLKKFSKVLEYYKEDELFQTVIKIQSLTGLSPKTIIPHIKGNEINPLHLCLNEKQLQTLYPFFNSLLIIPISFEDFNKLLNGETYNTTYQIKNIRELSALFKALSSNHYICNEWQKILGKNKLFSSKRGRILTSLDFAKAMNNAKDFGGTTYESDCIINIIDKLKIM